MLERRYMGKFVQHSDHKGPRWWFKPLISGVTSGIVRKLIDWLFFL